MVIDVLFALCIVMAVIKGIRRGLVIAVFSLLGLVVGLAAAIKLSAVTAKHLEDAVTVSAQWMPVISFALVFIAVLLIVHWAGKLIEKAMDVTMLGWLNRLGGVIFYAVLYIIILSVAIFYMSETNLISQQQIEHSRTYAFIQPWGPVVMNGMGKIIPIFQDMFITLKQFFGNMAEKLS